MSGLASRFGSAMLAVVLMAGGSVVSLAAAETLRLGHIYQPDSPSGLGYQAFADKVAEYTDGRITVQIFPAAQLGSARNIFTSLKSGAVDVGETTFPLLADTVPEFAVMTAGYAFRDFEHAQAVLDHPELGQKWTAELLEKSGLRMLGASYYGKRVVTTGDRAFRSPEEAAGLKIRAVPNPMSLAVIRGLGANPTPMPFPEVFIALTQGVIDGQENPYPTVWAERFYEVQSFAIETYHQIISTGFSISENTWANLSAEDQSTIERAAAEAMDLLTEATIDFENEVKDKLRAEGMTIVLHEELDIEAFRQSVSAEVAAEFEGNVWPEGLLGRVKNVGLE